MTDINRLIASLRRRSAHAKEFGHDVLFVKLEDLDALVEALEKAQQRNGELETYSKTAIEFREAARDENRHLKLELEIAEKRIAELESKLANPVQLPKTNGYWTETEKAYEEAITFAKRKIRLAGFRCEGDE
ncbi:hypothetical protein SM909_09455 [Klebsiella aerogenes]|uniref:hypothetical protein n=1 Tax=Klebsiella aerogenes TaxID=548 RepID=UPI002A82F591|nr:hypothetical protein [Klebsiella aerogenes]WPR95566.1 hypothetical protein SM909_09455 [Klebsiella aerogenes]